jgi:hypothetical protein
MSDLALRVKNTRTHRLEPFVPKEPGHVRMYVCGPSVYDESHLGHARSYVAYDAMKRFFLTRGLRVTHVQNFTDVEEHISERAQSVGMAPLDYATKLIHRFFEDMDALHVLRATHYPRVSEHIDEIIAIVRDLEKKRIAYRVDCGPRPHQTDGGCDVYFGVEKVKDYGALIGQNIEELTVERPDQYGDRRNPLDFALWKSRDDWGVLWESPYGKGRPGWHVECTAMARKYLGADFDLHGGGLDLVFPHHENERVIGEALTGERYCNHYLHNGFVTVGKEKMSKSLGNFVTIGELLRRHDPEVLRTFLLSAHAMARPLGARPRRRRVKRGCAASSRLGGAARGSVLGGSRRRFPLRAGTCRAGCSARSLLGSPWRRSRGRPRVLARRRARDGPAVEPCLNFRLRGRRVRPRASRCAGRTPSSRGRTSSRRPRPCSASSRDASIRGRACLAGSRR